MDPESKISAFREPSFGHGHLSVINSSHALWTWHRNEDDSVAAATASDKVWLRSLASLNCS